MKEKWRSQKIWENLDNLDLYLYIQSYDIETFYDEYTSRKGLLIYASAVHKQFKTK